MSYPFENYQMSQIRLWISNEYCRRDLGTHDINYIQNTTNLTRGMFNISQNGQDITVIYLNGEVITPLLNMIKSYINFLSFTLGYNPHIIPPPGMPYFHLPYTNFGTMIDGNCGNMTCKRLPDLRKDNNTNESRMIPMMYHILSGYELLHSVLLFDIQTVDFLENHDPTTWKANVLKRSNDIVLFYRNNIHIYPDGETLFVNRMLQSINNIIFLRDYNTNYCGFSGINDSAHIPFMVQLDFFQKKFMYGFKTTPTRTPLNFIL